MSTLEQIKAAILDLPSHDFQRLRQWLSDLDDGAWNPKKLEDVMSEMSQKAQARGLTPEILDSILNEE
jgi:hypothetical protein